MNVKSSHVNRSIGMTPMQENTRKKCEFGQTIKLRENITKSKPPLVIQLKQVYQILLRLDFVCFPGQTICYKHKYNEFHVITIFLKVSINLEWSYRFPFEPATKLEKQRQNLYQILFIRKISKHGCKFFHFRSLLYFQVIDGVHVFGSIPER